MVVKNYWKEFEKCFILNLKKYRNKGIFKGFTQFIILKY